MKTIAKLLTILMVVNLLFLNSCKEEEDRTKFKLLSERTWHKIKTEVETTDATIDVSDSYNVECNQDDIYSFTKEGNYIWEPGEDDCDGMIGVISGTWKLENGDQIIAITLDGITYDEEILILTENSLKLKSELRELDLDSDEVNETEGYIINTFSAY